MRRTMIQRESYQLGRGMALVLRNGSPRMPKGIGGDIFQLVRMSFVVASPDVSDAFVDALIEILLVGIGFGEVEQCFSASVFIE